MRKWNKWVLFGALMIAVTGIFTRVFIVAETGVEMVSDGVTGEHTYEIVSLLPRDAIPAINNPQFVSGDDANAIYHPDELVLGVEIDGDARAYSIPFLSGHEIVNDEVGGVSIAVTW